MKLLIVSVLTIVAVLLLQAAASAQSKQREETVAVRGLVVDEVGAPISGASVSVRHHGERMASVCSAADGSFMLDVPKQSFDGVLLLASDEQGDRLGTLVHPDQGRGADESVKIVLRKAAKVEVRVTDAQGQFIMGARVAASYRQQPLAEQMTDEAGLATLRVPAGVKLLICAVQRDAGLDYAHPTFESDERLDLVLRGMVNVRVKVLDQREQPIAGAKVYPVSLGRMHEAMLSFHAANIGEFQETTDKSGVANCRIPIDNIYHVPIQVVAEGYMRAPWVYWIPDDRVTGVRTGMTVPNFRTVSGEEFTVDLKPAVTIRGSVVHADGRPAAGASVGAFGQGYGNTSYVQGATCDDRGAFQIALAPDMYYGFNVTAGDERCRDQMRVIVAGRAVEPLKLVLQSPRRVSGTLTGADQKPQPNQHLSLVWRDEESHSKLPVEQQLPNPNNDPAPITLGIWTNGRTDEHGRFEFLMPPGRYHVVTPDKMNEAVSSRDRAPDLPEVDVTHQTEARIDLKSEK